MVAETGNRAAKGVVSGRRLPRSGFVQQAPGQNPNKNRSLAGRRSRSVGWKAQLAASERFIREHCVRSIASESRSPVNRPDPSSHLIEWGPAHSVVRTGEQGNGERVREKKRSPAAIRLTAAEHARRRRGRRGAVAAMLAEARRLHNHPA